MYDKKKYKELYSKSGNYRAGRIRHAKEYNTRNKDKYDSYQRMYRMKKRLEKDLDGFVCQARISMAADVMMAAFKREFEILNRNS